MYDGHSNQITKFHLSTGHLTLTWKYKYLKKEVVHNPQFDNVRNLSIFEQRRIADRMIRKELLINTNETSSENT